MKKIKMIFPVFWLLVLMAIGSYYMWGAEHDSVFSEEENRMLAGFPALDKAILNGSLDSDTEKYFLDHFPKRNLVISISNSLKSKISIATYHDFVNAVDQKSDSLTEETNQGTIDDLINDLLNSNTPKPSNSPSALPTAEPVPSEVPVPTERPQVSPIEQISPTPLVPTNTPTPTVSPTPAEYPPIEHKPSANIEDFAEEMSDYMLINNKKYVVFPYFKNSATGNYTYTRKAALALTAVLNKYANVLPEGGKLMFTMAPSSQYVYKYNFVNTGVVMKSDAIPLINAFGADNVYAYYAGEIISEYLDRGEYLFYKTDRHWTPLAAYLVYREMIARAGFEPADYENDFYHYKEYPFLGTYYRDNPKDYMKNDPDTLEALEPLFGHELRKITGKDSYKVIPYLDYNAKSNDRYCVNIGGPSGPWIYAECDNDATENCLVIMDSFGCSYLSYLTQHYKQVHYYDPRYFDKSVVGYSVSEMIAKYNIKDIFVVVGDLNAANRDFMLEKANKQFDE